MWWSTGNPETFLSALRVCFVVGVEQPASGRFSVAREVLIMYKEKKKSSQ